MNTKSILVYAFNSTILTISIITTTVFTFFRCYIHKFPLLCPFCIIIQMRAHTEYVSGQWSETIAISNGLPDVKVNGTRSSMESALPKTTAAYIVVGLIVSIIAIVGLILLIALCKRRNYRRRILKRQVRISYYSVHVELALRIALYVSIGHAP